MKEKVEDVIGFLGTDYVADDIYVKSKKKSNTLIILGSGSSIMDLGSEFWNFCDNHDTLAINWWVYHWYVPTFWMFELGDYKNDDLFSCWSFHWEREKERTDIFHKEIDKIKDIVWLMPRRFKDFSFEYYRTYMKRYIPDENNKVFFYDRLKDNEWVNNLPLIFKETKGDVHGCVVPPCLVISPLVYALTFGYHMNYSRIILAGMELDNSKYFWSDWKWAENNMHLKTSVNRNEKEMHITEYVPDLDMIPASQVVKLINEFVFKSNDVELLTTTKKGLLYPEISHFHVRPESKITKLPSVKNPFKAEYLIDSKKVFNWKESDTLVILGTGESINYLSGEFWDNCYKCDTVAINWWVYHWFVPNFWFIETDWTNSRLSAIWLKELNKKHPKAYEDVIWFYSRRDQENCTKESIERVFKNVILKHLPKDPKIFLYDRVVYEYWPQNLCDMYFKNIKIIDGYFLPHTYTGTLIPAIWFGVQMGYEKIILAGIDLMSPFYFWSRYDMPVHSRMGDARWIGLKHSTELNDYPLSRAVLDLKEQVLDELEIELYLANHKSLLSPFIPSISSNFMKGLFDE